MRNTLGGAESLTGPLTPILKFESEDCTDPTSYYIVCTNYTEKPHLCKSHECDTNPWG